MPLLKNKRRVEEGNSRDNIVENPIYQNSISKHRKKTKTQYLLQILKNLIKIFLKNQGLMAIRHKYNPQIYLNPKKVGKSLHVEPKYLLLSNQKKITKRGKTLTIQKPKGMTSKVQPYGYSISIIYTPVLL